MLPHKNLEEFAIIAPAVQEKGDYKLHKKKLKQDPIEILQKSVDGYAMLLNLKRSV